MAEHFTGWLFADKSNDSKLAAEYLEKSGFEFERIDPKLLRTEDYRVNGNVFGHFLKKSKRSRIPYLSGRIPGVIGYFGYPSLSGVKAYIRDRIGEDLFGDKFGLKPGRFWKNVKRISYSSDGNVSCFDENGEKIFEGPLEESPIKIQPHLSKHPYKSWNEVSAWKVGKLEELAEKQNEQGIIIDEPTRTILFPDDIEILKGRGIIVTKDSGTIMSADFEAYFARGSGKRREVFGVYASMFD